MTGQPPFPVEPWCVRETTLDLDRLAQSESVLALSNGHIGLRGNLDEGEPHGIAGTYLNSFHERRPLPYAEGGYGYPESGQTVVNVTDGKIIRLLVDDAPFDVRYGTLHHHERRLDLRNGVLTREADWTSPAGRRVRVRSRRLVSFTQRAVAAIEYQVEAVDAAVRVIVQSELITNEEQSTTSVDPRVAAALENPLEAVEHVVGSHSALLVHRTRVSKQLMAAGMEHIVTGGEDVVVESDGEPCWARTNVTGVLRPGATLTVVKTMAYGWSSIRSVPSLRDQVAAALIGARRTGFAGLLREQQEYLREFWDNADVVIEGDAQLQQAVRFGLFHVLQSGARAERRAIPAKGLTGPGYDGHTFWDTEGFVLPVLTYTQPRAAADALRWRHSTLWLARERAQALGLRGAAFPWRTIRGQECSGYWPAGTAGFHVNADIADAVLRYRMVTGDDTLDRECGVELLVETARLWDSLGHFDRRGVWHLPGVTGPDEYSALSDDNIFTNLMAARNLRGAADAVARHPDLADRLGVTDREALSWRTAAAAVHLPYDPELEVHEQSAGFTGHPEWAFTDDPAQYPLLLSAPYFELYRRQVVKQADLVLAMHWCGDAFTPAQKARNLDYYERRTVRDSSLSAGTQAVLAAETGHLELAHRYAREAATVDLLDLHHNSRDGLHMASLASAWTAIVSGFGGLRDHGGVLSFDPALPAGINRLRFAVRWQGRSLRVTVTSTQATYALHDEDPRPLTLVHAGAGLEVANDRPQTVALRKRVAALPTPEQPPGRRPGDGQ
ncbi:glycosyl hydrolase family 65 protein [Actinoplanes sp. NPDC048967]|uniref:glycoside hydrolase family 65 protein n=1 Tax=Actinoplanes sp. NPDC048967 TaxID=3155269 RepID=UPI0033F995D7